MYDELRHDHTRDTGGYSDLTPNPPSDRFLISNPAYHSDRAPPGYYTASDGLPGAPEYESADFQSEYKRRPEGYLDISPTPTEV